MTNEEAIKCLKSLVEVRKKYGDMQTMKDEIECLDMAIQALEQEPILDKIRAKMDGLLNDEDNLMYAHGVMDCLKIIDKYKAESEE